MPTGLQIINDSGRIQIDQNYYVLSFISKTTLTMTVVTAHDGIQSSSGTVTVAGTQPVIAFLSGQPIAMVGVVVSGPNSTFTFWGPAVASSATIYVFDRPAPLAHGVGLQVLDASGNVTYQSGWLPMKVVDAITVSNGSAKTEPSGPTYAIIQSYRHLVLVNTGGPHPNLEFSTVGVSIVGNQIDGLTVLVGDGTATSGGSVNGFFDLVIDVTGL